MERVPELRIHSDDAPIREDGDFVLYWMTATRRTRANEALRRAVEHARALDRPLLVLEPLRLGYEHASDRFHHFIIQGMADQAQTFAERGITYYPYVERKLDDGKGLLAALAERACLVVTDLYPCFFHPRMQAAARRQLSVRLESIDSLGLLPLRALERPHATAHSLRRFLQKVLPAHLAERAPTDSLAGPISEERAEIPPKVLEQWPAVTEAELEDLSWIGSLPIDHTVGPVDVKGGERSALEHMDRFLDRRFPRYAEARNHPEDPVTSGLSPWLHFGHLSTTTLFDAIIELEDWGPEHLGSKVNGARQGWWGMSEAAEGFLDQMITWRELGAQLCWFEPDYDQYESLPEWARKTLAEHAEDPRDPLYTLEQLENGKTDDPLWNAAQGQLKDEGIIHNYLRMLWGKKVLHWAESPKEAFQILLYLNNKYALDGRDPNSYSAISWIFGRFDRAWGPEREIFGKIRYMSSENTARKVRVRHYIREYAP